MEMLLFDIPSISVIELLALMDAELYAHQEDEDSQVKLMDLMLNRQPPAVIGNIMSNALKGRQTHVHFFSQHYNMHLLHYELINYRELPVPEGDLTPEQELRIFKAYFLAAQLAGNTLVYKSEGLPEFNEDYFSKMLWPGLADQFEFHFRINPYYFMIRGVVLLNHLQFHTPYGAYVEAYLRQHQKPTVLNYFLDIFQMLIANTKSLNDPNRDFAAFSIQRSPGFESLFRQFTMDRHHYTKTYSGGKQNYAGLKSKPLYQLDEKKWLILNWGFLANKLYEGLVFDFYLESGIASDPKFSGITAFKQFISQEVTDQKLFRKLLKAAFDHRYGTLLFDDGQIAGFPDAYYRQGNRVYLIELKDAYFPSEAAGSYSYEQIIAAIDKKINNKGKGTGQIIKQLTYLSKQPYEEAGRYKHTRNLEIYPVIVYTDILFNMPGVNYYVEQSFRRQVKEHDLEKHFKVVKPLTLMNISYLIEIFDQLKKPETDLGKLVCYHHQQIKTRKKRHDRTNSMSDHITIYDVFEHVVSHIFPEPQDCSDYIRTVTHTLDLDEGVPGWKPR
ncbi:hypothetical protein HDF23_000492 [Mucilaginibacter lappiensis]|uniref:PD-(D/E)XK nuclease superfamily protein n=2 Tax=Mucilaginibacter lappiensis TaxID=354630 RepID=A0ABR6PDB6_9SPHI|nr:hypothetical protein [Mucilaginibacter lappiensis]